MGLYNNGDIMTEFLIRNDISTTDGFISDLTLQGWLKDAHMYCTSYKKWPFTEGRVSTTFVSQEEWNFEGYKSESFRMLLIGGKRLTKLNFQDYMTFRESQPQGNDRVFSDFSRVLYINPYADVSGTLTAYGQYQPVLDVTDMTAITVFSGFDEEGNEAILQKMTEFLMIKKHSLQEAVSYNQLADVMLEKVYKRISDEQYGYQTHPDTGGMFKPFDVLGGRQKNDLNNPNQF